jgi:hypothetical protein
VTPGKKPKNSGGKRGKKLAPSEKEEEKRVKQTERLDGGVCFVAVEVIERAERREEKRRPGLSIQLGGTMEPRSRAIESGG